MLPRSVKRIGLYSEMGPIVKSIVPAGIVVALILANKSTLGKASW